MSYKMKLAALFLGSAFLGAGSQIQSAAPIKTALPEKTSIPTTPDTNTTYFMVKPSPEELSNFVLQRLKYLEAAMIDYKEAVSDFEKDELGKVVESNLKIAKNALNMYLKFAKISPGIYENLEIEKNKTPLELSTLFDENTAKALILYAIEEENTQLLLSHKEEYDSQNVEHLWSLSTMLRTTIPDIHKRVMARIEGDGHKDLEEREKQLEKDGFKEIPGHNGIYYRPACGSNGIQCI